MTNVERLIVSEARRDLCGIMRDVREGYLQGLRGDDLVEVTRRACAERECAVMARGAER